MSRPKSRLPAVSQLQAVDAWARSSSSRPSIATKLQTAATKAPATEPVAMMPAARRLIVLPASVIASAPASGRKRQIQAAGIMSAAKGRRAVGVERDVPSGHGDDQPESDDDLGRRDGHHRERKDLPVERVVLARERDEREVRRVQHQLQREEDDERVAAEEHSERADGEETSRDCEIPGDVRAQHLCPLPPALRRSWHKVGTDTTQVPGTCSIAAGHEASSSTRLACAPRMTPPTAATSSTIDVI